ncbi:hypothetical protein JW930_03085 [Candidatus Woesearchaeota archaeon]|nr:hypothetical protein [Candidatus Woesearchaeota archaeon]
MRLNKNYVVLSLFMVILLNYSAHALLVSGEKMKVEFQFTPNDRKEFSYYFLNNDYHTSDYVIIAETHKGADLTKYFTIEPDTFKSIHVGEHREFKIKVNLPEKIEVPGLNEVRVWVKGTPSEGTSGMVALPVVGVRFMISVLFPYKYLEWGLNIGNMNIDEKQNVVLTLRNLGEPTIESIYGKIEIINLETNETVRSMTTNTINNLISWQESQVSATFNSNGLRAGNYRAIATLYWDENSSRQEREFRIGQLEVFIRDFTKIFQKDAINRMMINVESGWNTLIEKLYADIEVFDSEGNQRKKFRSFDKDLGAWKTESLEAYFDTTGLNVSNYSIKVTLVYEGATTVKEGVIEIVDQANVETVDKIPRKSFFSMSLINSTSLLVIVLIIFVIINLILLLRKRKKDIDPEVVENIRKVLEKHSDTEVEQMLIKKGWQKDTIKEIIRQAKAKKKAS